MDEYIVTLILTNTTQWAHVTVTEAELKDLGIRDSVEDKFGIGTKFRVYSVSIR